MGSFSQVINLAKTSSSDHDLKVAKIASMFILGFSALICAVLPIIVVKSLSKRNREKNSNFNVKFEFGLAIMLRLGGGILLATTFLHLLPETREAFEDLKLQNWPEYIPELVMCVGFFMMYAIEELAHMFLHRHRHSDNDNAQCVDGIRQTAVSDTSGEEQKGHSHVVEGPPLRGILIIIALSVHQIFEGMAIGLQGTTTDVWVLLGAIAAHKLVIALCVGAEMASARTTILTATICVGVFAIASPIGIGIGLATYAVSGDDSDDQSEQIASTILQGFATGTLLYVVFFEVLTKPQESDRAGLLYFFVAIIGFILMTILIATLPS